MAIRLYEGRTVNYTPGSAVAAGAIVAQGDLVGVAERAIPANTLGALAVEGVFNHAKPTGTSTAITVGAKVYFDSGNNVITGTASGNKYVGKAVAAAADADTTVTFRFDQ